VKDLITRLWWLGLAAYPAMVVCGLWTATGHAPPLVDGITTGLTISFIIRVAIAFRRPR
jgi:hypothetical protein